MGGWEAGRGLVCMSGGGSKRDGLCLGRVPAAVGDEPRQPDDLDGRRGIYSLVQIGIAGPGLDASVVPPPLPPKLG